LKNDHLENFSESFSKIFGKFVIKKEGKNRIKNHEFAQEVIKSGKFEFLYVTDN